MTRWHHLPSDTIRLSEGDPYRVRDARGAVHETTLQRSPGGGRAFYDADGEPVDAIAVEIS